MHCSIPVPARNRGYFLFLREAPNLFHMANVLSKSKPRHGREITARQATVPRKSSIETALASNWDSDRSRRAWTSIVLRGRTPSPWSPQPSPYLAAACVHPLSAPEHRGLAPGERLHRLGTILLNLRRWHSSPFGAELLVIVLLRKKHIDTTRSVAKALALSAATNISAVGLVHPPTQTRQL